MKITYAEGVQPTQTGASEETKSGMALALERVRKQADRRAVREIGVREIKRIQRRDAASQTKKATRNWRRAKIQAVQDEANALGLARVYLLHRGTPDLQDTVKHHVEVELANAIASQMNIDLQDAQARLVTRFEDVLRQAGEL